MVRRPWLAENPRASRRLRPATAGIATAALLAISPLHAQAGDAVSFARDVVIAGDAGNRAFAVIDKKSASISVFDQAGRLQAQAAVLLGEARGDRAPEDIGRRPLSSIHRSEKITSAGRYETEAGVNTHGEDIVWLDYEAALSMHRVRHVPGENRPHRLATPGIDDNRISFGCVNMPPDFYEAQIAPLFYDDSRVVYVLPEQEPLGTFFPFASHR